MLKELSMVLLGAPDLAHLAGQIQGTVQGNT